MQETPLPAPLPAPPPPPNGGPTVAYAGTSVPSAGLSARELYGQVPRLRRNSFNTGLTLLALTTWLAAPFVAGLGALLRMGVVAVLLPVVLILTAGVSLLVVCVIVLTGPVYFPKFGRNGRLKSWGWANKVVAVLLLAVCLVTGFAISASVLRHLRV